MPKKKYQIAVLDDYQNVALESADPETVIERLRPFDVVCVMRERAPLPRNVIERLPNLKLIASTGGIFTTSGLLTIKRSERGRGAGHRRRV